MRQSILVTLFIQSFLSVGPQERCSPGRRRIQELHRNHGRTRGLFCQVHLPGNPVSHGTFPPPHASNDQDHLVLL